MIRGATSSSDAAGGNVHRVVLPGAHYLVAQCHNKRRPPESALASHTGRREELVAEPEEVA